MVSVISMISDAAESLGRIAASRPRLMLQVLSGAILLLAILAPVLSMGHLDRVALTIYRVLSVACHQQADRCLHISDESLGVCARCTGGYLGFFIMSLMIGGRFSKVRWLSNACRIALVIGGADIALQYIGLYDTSNLPRLASGMAFGVGIGGIVFAFVSELESEKKSVHCAPVNSYICP